MDVTLLIHIVAGSLALVSGYLALFARKGAALHRRGGMLFVWAMLVMCTFGALVAALHSAAPALNIPAATMTAYLVVTGLLAVRPEPPPRWLVVTLLIVAAGTALVDLAFGMEAIASGGRRKGMPAFGFLMFTAIGLVACIGDVRLLRGRVLRGGLRLRRHLWRMGFALYVAAMSFFIGQADVIPKPLRVGPLLALPGLLVLASIAWWSWRLRRRPNHPRVVVRSEAAVAAGGGVGAPSSVSGGNVDISPQGQGAVTGL